MRLARCTLPGLLGLACIAPVACSNSGYSVVVRFDTPALAAMVEHVDVSLVASCAEQGRAGEPAIGARQAVEIARGGSSAPLGDTAPGRYGLYARGSSAGCAVVAAGCSDVTLAAGGEDVLVVTLAPVSGPGCPAGTTCSAGACRGPDAATVDASVDAGLPDAGGADSARPDGGGPIDGGACTPATASCSGATLTVCGADGMIATSECRLGCSPSDPTRCARVAASNVASGSLASGTLDLSVPSGDYTFDTGACSALGASGDIVTQGDGTELCVLALRSLSIAAGATLIATGPRPLVFLASGDMNVAGNIDVSAYGVAPGAGGGRPGSAATAEATGPAPGGPGAHVGTYQDGGGGGGGMCGGGGAGGAGAMAMGGAGGSAAAASGELSPLHGGSGGARGAGTDNIAAGGGGGGAIQLSAAGTIAISGRILAAGGGGAGGRPAFGCMLNAGAGAGGGSGGAVLIEAATIVVAGSTILAGGGGGGGGAQCAALGAGGAGGPGQDAAAAIGPAAGGTSGGSRYGAAGGAGAGGATVDGEVGPSNLMTDANGGGGGGGAGCILLRQFGGALPAGLTTSPSVSPGVRALAVRVE